MRATPIATILRRIRPLAPIHQIAHLRAALSQEKPKSIRRVELEAALKEIVNKQLKRESRAA